MNKYLHLKTGNVSYSINNSVSAFIEDTTNNIVYISSYIDNDKFKLYNSNGKLLFDGKTFTMMDVIGGNLIVANETFGQRLLSIHNIRFLTKLTEDLRIAIKEDNILEYKDKFIESYCDKNENNK